MNYGKYKNARNATWQCLIDYKVKQLPVITSEIAYQAEINIIKNSTAKILKPNQSGLCVIQENETYIIYDNNQSNQRNRFTIAHELGHIFLGHLTKQENQYRTFTKNTIEEQQANVFARSLLCPACVLHELKAHTAEEIASLCDVSLESARIRAERIKLLRDRNAWYTHPLERQVKEQFNVFINQK